nr:putative ribonuclease H-like domain-containing protein [Tanacetum cinerariifolium]
KQRHVVCYNCKGEGHMSKQCTKPKRKRDEAWFKDKVLLVQAQANGQVLHGEELEFLIALMANLSHYGSDNLAEVHNPDNVTNNVIDQDVQAMLISEQSNIMNQLDTEITIEVPKELLKVSMVNSSLKKLKFHLASFDVVVKERTTATTITKGTWGFEHIKACFRDKIILFVKALKDLFNSFDQFLIDELSEVQIVFNQMEQSVEQHSVEKIRFQDKMKDVLKENERLLEQAISKDIVNIVVTANVNYACETVNECERCVTLETELQQDFIKRECYDKLKVWNPTGKVFTNIGYKWRPTGRTFTIVGNAFPLTRITTTAKVLLRKPIPLESNTSKPVARQGLFRGLPKLKFEKDHLCSSCAMGKSKKKSHKPKSKDTNQEKLYLLHMDLCGRMRVKSVNGKKHILVIVDDYSRFTWVKRLRSKDETPDFIIKFLKMIQVRLKVPVRRIPTDNGTEFVNQTLREYYEQVGISHKTSVARSPQQNGVVKRRNRTLIEAVRTMFIYVHALLFLWAEAVATACYTQNRSIESYNQRLILGSSLVMHQQRRHSGFTTDVPDELLKLFMTRAKPTSSTQFVPPTRNEWDILFQPLFDELLIPPPNVDPLATDVIAPIDEVIPLVHAESTGSPSSTTVDQDVPSPSKSQTTPKTQPHVIPNDVE